MRLLETRDDPVPVSIQWEASRVPPWESLSGCWRRGWPVTPSSTDTIRAADKR